MMVSLFGLRHCSTCKKAIGWLDAHGIEHSFVDYREAPIPAQDLQAFADQLGWEKLVNRASQTWRGLPEARKSPQCDADWLALVHSNPTLIRRPLLVRADGKALAGFSAARYAETFAATE